MVNLWERFTHMYGHKFTSVYGEQSIFADGELTDVAKTWASGLRGVTGEQLASGLRACITRVDPWPPSLPEFVSMCTGKGENEFGLDYVPEYYRHESRPERILESDQDKQCRKEAAKVGIAAMRAAMKSG